jgi:DNA-binding response OmpR family regulator
VKILLIEDNQKISKALKTGLKNIGHVVECAFDGEEGLNFALEEQYDVIILDLMLPILTGEDVCRKIREADNTTPILMLTAKSSTENIIGGLDLGADDYLTKPFEFNELLARLKAITRRPKTSFNKTILVGSLKIETTNYSVELKDKNIDLGKKEYLILEYLAKNKGAVISKDKILDQVWGFESEATENTIEVYINSLRKKLGKDVIETKRGLGYVINDK